MSKQRLHVSLLLLFSAVLFLYGSSRLPFLGPDEPRYSQVARQMLESGDYIVPRLGAFAWFEKPVLLYWMMAGLYSIFGVSEFAARFPSMLSALLCLYIVYSTVARIAGTTHAYLSAVILATTVFFVGFAHAATFDMLLTFTITACICLFLLAELHPNEKKYLRGAYLFLALGILAKGFVAPVLVLLAVGSYCVVSRRWHPGRLRPWRGILIVIAVCSLWFVPITILYGWRFWDEFVYQHHFVRYTSSYYHRTGNAFFYVPIFLIGTFPWTLAPLIKRPDTSTASRRALVRLSVCWLVTCIIFFSFSQSKLPGYVLPAVPAFAILAGLSLGDLLQNRLANYRRLLPIAVWNVLTAIVLLLMAKTYPAAAGCVTSYAILTLLFTSMAAIFVQRRAFRSALAAQAVIVITALVIGVNWLPGRLNWYDARQLSLEVLPRLNGSQKLVFYNVYDFGPLFYTNARIELTPEGYLYNLPNDRQLYRYLNEKKEAFVVVGNEELSWIRSAEFWRVVEIFPGAQNSIVHLRVR